MVENAPVPLTPLQRAFLALEEARERIAALESATCEPIAIIGFGLRAPGGVNDAETFWRLLADGVDAIGPVPPERWNHESYYHSNPDTPGHIATRHGGFLHDIDQFDAGFFGISPREADAMDPQQRLLLTVAWEALEKAGQAPDRLQGSRTGVYVGVTGSDYAYLQLGSDDPGLLDAHFASGIAHSIVSARISYLLGLQGPSLTVDTACSSSLVAIHLAVQALRNGDCRMALAGGVNLILSPDIFVSLSRARMLAPDGRCKAFAAAADGFARAEGCGLIVLKRLSDALSDGDDVMAVIRSSMINQDGASGSLTAPNGPAQELVIREALARGGLKPHEISLIEAHGTGTQLGDPIEVHALGAVFSGDRGATNPLMLGSVKTNIGHAEAAAGVLGVIKAVLATRHRAVPAHLHFDKPSEHIRWESLPFEVPTRLTPWTPPGRRLAGVSSFGFSGTNAHVVLEEAPVARPSSAIAASERERPHLLAVSARDAEMLAVTMSRLAERLRERPELVLKDVVRTLNLGRAQFNHRATVLASSTVEAADALTALAVGRPATGTRRGIVSRRDPPRVAFLFTGQGSQYAGMARGLYESCSTFRESLDQCAALLRPHLQRPLLEVLFSADVELVDQTEFSQPALFAVEYALTEVWRAFAVTPSVVIGHSVGEYVAATIAGVLTLPDALRLVAARGRLMQSLPSGGGMAAVFASEAKVAEVIATNQFALSIAAVNGPLQTVVSGPSAMLDALCTSLATANVTSTRLPVSHAFHSALVEPVLPAFERELAQTRFSAPKLRLISNLTGRSATAAEITSSSYWRDHMRQPVRFGAGLQALAETKPDLLIEIGPHPALLSFASAVFKDASTKLLPSLRKGRSDWEQMLDALAQAYLAGVAIDWSNTASGGRVVDLPGHALRGERHWFRANVGKTRRKEQTSTIRLPGTRLRLATEGAVFEATVGADQPAYARQHRVQDQIVFPAAAYLTMLDAAARTLRPGIGVAIKEIAIGEAMLLDDDGRTRIVQTVFDPDGADAFRVRVMSQNQDADGEWTLHLSGYVVFADPSVPERSLSEGKANCISEVPVAQLYESFEARGLQFGPDFKTVRTLRSGTSQALGDIALAGSGGDPSDLAIHPLLLDGCLQAAAASMSGDSSASLNLPVGIGSFAIYGQASEHCFSHVQIRSSVGTTVHADVTIFAPNGAVLATLADVQFVPVGRDALERLGSRWLDDCLYEQKWLPAPLAKRAIDLEPEALVRSTSTLLPALRESSDISAHDRASERLKTLCIGYAARALSELGVDLQAGSRVAGAELAERVGVVARHRRLFDRLFTMLEQAGVLSRVSDGWRVVRNPPIIDVEAEARRLVVDEPSIGAELEMTVRVASRLSDALRGRLDEADLLFPGGSTENAERIYRESPTAKLFNGLMAELAAAIDSARATGHPLRILEVGAGTGGTTAYVLKRLPGDVEYTFTDIGQLFVARARERFGADGRMEFAKLNIEREPAEQGFADRRFDLVIASNVVHATTDLRNTLARLHGLIAPGGLLAMLEVTGQQEWFDLTVGLTEGWWAFTDTDLRSNYPLLSRDAWFKVLEDCRFDSVATLPRQAASVGALSRQAIFLARASHSPWLLFEDEGGACAELADRLRRAGRTCIVVRSGTYGWDGDEVRLDPTSDAGYRRLFEDLARAGRQPGQVVHALSLSIGSETTSAVARERGVLSVMRLAQAMLTTSPVPRLWVLTNGAQAVCGDEQALTPLQAPVWGLGRSLALEHPELRCTCIDFDAASMDALVEELIGDPAERDIALRSGRRSAARLQRLGKVAKPISQAAPWRIETAQSGSIEAFVRIPHDRRGPGPGEVEISVEASGLNFKDVLNALGQYPGDPGPLGSECAGRVVAVGAGVHHVSPFDAVMAIAGGAFASHVIARSELVRRRPAGVTAEEGATFPIAFLTAAFCLDHVARLSSGETVLVHAAAGGVGLAAVQIARRAGARIIATAGTPTKRAMLRGLGIEHVFDSRSPAFASDVLRVTQGRGVNVVLNSLGGQLVDASFQAIADGGRFIEIGKRGIKSPEWVSALGRQIRYDVIDWGETAQREPLLIGRLFEQLTTDLAEGRLTPLPRHAYSTERIAQAFRLMARGGHVGRIVVVHTPSAPQLARRNGTYLITGGLSGLGLAVARHLAERGAGRLVLLGRRGPGEEALQAINDIRRSGTEVVSEAADVSDEGALAAVLNRVRSQGPPLRGVVHAAGVLVNRALIQQDAESFSQVLAPKVDGAALLHKLTRSDPLDWFVLFSSIAGSLGAAGQASHAAANAYLDQLIRQRHAVGLPGLSIGWGAWSEIGAAAALEDQISALGISFLTPRQGLATFGRLVESLTPQALVLPIAWDRYRARIGAGVHTSLLAGVEETSLSIRQPGRSTPQPPRDLRREIEGAPAHRRARMVADFVRERALVALGMDLARPVDPRTPLGELGLDSLLSVELRNVLGAALGRSFPATLLFDYPTIEALSGFIMRECWQVDEPEKASPQPDAVERVEDLTEQEVDRLLRSKYGMSV